jgi:hypothetical protein
VDPGALTAETRVPFGSLATLLDQAGAATGRADLGLLLGERFEFAHHGAIADLMWTAPKLGAALRAFTRLQPGSSSGAVVCLHAKGDMTAFGSAIGSTSVRPGRAYTDLVLAIGARMTAFVTGGAVPVSEVFVTHRRPADIKPYARVFGAPVRFGEPLSCMYLPVAALSAPLPGRDARRHSSILGQIDEARRGQKPALETLVGARFAS